ncbi:MAG: hypothetical protein GTO02_02130, partial [Candidatus Dadabacteria bacterium]|nr:hypothetical protein [Candidatus Dadabacteria bacterium]
SELTDKEVVDYYYKHIETDTNYKEVDGRFFYETPDIDEFDYAEHSGSDIQGMRWECPKRK